MEHEKPAVHLPLYQLARVSLGVFWLYQGFVPKVIRPSSESIELLALAGVEAKIALDALYAIGLAEIALGLTLLSTSRWRWPLWSSLLLIGAYVLGTGIAAPKYLVTAYSPAAVGLLVVPLSIIALRTFPRRAGPTT